MKQLKKEEFNKFFKEYSEMVHGKNKGSKSNNLKGLFDKYGLEMKFPKEMQKNIDIAMLKPIESDIISRNGCAVCAACALCTFCGEANALSGAGGLIGLAGLA